MEKRKKRKNLGKKVRKPRRERKASLEGGQREGMGGKEGEKKG